MRIAGLRTRLVRRCSLSTRPTQHERRPRRSHRHRACAREIEVNSRFAPELYLGCVPIVRSPATGSLAFGGDGEVLEWAVRRFDQSALLSHVAAEGEIEAELAKRLADAVLESHRHAKSTVSNDGIGPFKAILATLSRSLTAASAFPGKAARSFLIAAERHLALAAEILDERARSGHVRRCHGDIHLANVVLWQDRPVLYDGSRPLTSMPHHAPIACATTK